MCIFYISLYVVVFFYSCVNTSVFRISFSLCRSHFLHYMLTILFVFLHHSFISIFQAMRFCLHFLFLLSSQLCSEFILHSFGCALSPFLSHSLTLRLSRPLARSSHINAFEVHCCQCRFSLFSIIFRMYQSTVGLICHVTDSNFCVFFICVSIVFIEFLFSFRVSTWCVVINIVFFACRIYLS